MTKQTSPVAHHPTPSSIQVALAPVTPKAWWLNPKRFFRAAWRWMRVFWPVLVTLWAGLTLFTHVIDESINATPHPELVYGIFAVAGVTVLILAYLQHVLVSEHGWIEALENEPLPNRAPMLLKHRGDSALKGVYRMLAQTRALPLRERQVAMETELLGAETHLMARLAMPNFLAGSLVGLGLVGTFIGLLATLQDLSGVFAAMGAGGGGDASAMFTGMIEKMQGPMRGMGTAFVASLYGLLGSLVMGLVVSGVKRTAERMLSDLHIVVNDDIYTASQLTAHKPNDVQHGDGAIFAAMSVWSQNLMSAMQEQRSDLQLQREQLQALTQATQRAQALTDTTHQAQAAFEGLVQGLGQQVATLSQVLERTAQSQQQSVLRWSAAHEGLLQSMAELRAEVRAAAGRQVLVLGRGASLYLGGALVAALLAVAVQWLVLGKYVKADQSEPGRTDAVTVPEMALPATGARSEAPSLPLAPVQPSAAQASAPVVVSPVEASLPTKPAEVSPASGTRAADARVVVVAKGDSWWRLASRHGVTVAQLLAVNPEWDHMSTLHVGQILVLPPHATP
ncbi:LysM peptidoglycan-binding domain-containing protein [Limnohabitans sp. DCL3]|uniref:LysM peptidoglycan-binding domain-containing protein n=1 Tax=Limnohabitans sp. DCL3 TaxID=3374103 RepID=UPI003A85A9A3